MRRSVVGAILLAALIGAGCGDGSAEKKREHDSSSGDGDNSSGDGDGDVPSGDGDGRDASGQCLNTDTNSACTDGELSAHSSCISRQCGTSYEACFGAGYARGEYAGPCRDWISCTQACDCDDRACFLGCGQPSNACADCLLSASTCIEEKCPAPACLSETSGDGDDDPGSPQCEKLSACCASMADEDFKAACELTYEQAKLTGDIACGALYEGFVQEQLCE